MKRRSMLGRRSRAVPQSPVAATVPSQSIGPGRNPETPRLDNRGKTSPLPFHTPSINGSLNDSRISAPWSVFKNCNVVSLRSPTNNDEERRSTVEARVTHGSRLNRFKKHDPLSELRNVGFSNILSKKTGINTAALGSGFAKVTKQPSDVPPVRSKDFKLNKNKQQKNVKGSSSDERKENKVDCMDDELDAERVTRELLSLQKKWEHQDIRTVSPPWSNGPSALPDSNLSTPRPIPPITVSSPPKFSKPVDFSATLGVAPLESTLVIKKDEIEEEKQDASFCELESMINEETYGNHQSLDLSSVLGTATLGVHTVELLDQPNKSLTKKSWGDKFKSPLSALTEEPEQSMVGKENVPPDVAEDFCSPEPSNESVATGVGSPCSNNSNLYKEFQARLVDLTLKIETAEEKRAQAEKERRFFEGERKKVFVEFFEFLDNNQQTLSLPISKRRKIAPNSAKKTRPSVVASKLLKKDLRMHTPKDIGAYLCTPSQIPGTVASMLVPLTPRSIRKNINQQINSIFGSQSDVPFTFN